jgi:predicted lipid-binding transport protein (Tim44 family)
MKLNIKAFGLSAAILYTVGVIWAFIMAMTGVSNAPLEVINGFYLGWLSPTIGGLILGMIIAFIDGLIAAIIFAWLYNKIANV